ncbi:hypothetical protein GCM10027076_32080 [Nocardioides montaniterrae]
MVEEQTEHRATNDCADKHRAEPEKVAAAHSRKLPQRSPAARVRSAPGKAKAAGVIRWHPF